MSNRPQSSVVLGTAGTLLVLGVLLGLFASLAFGIALVVAAACLPMFFRRG